MSDRERVRRGIESAIDGITEDLIAVDRQVVAVTWPIASYRAAEGQVTTYHALVADYCSDKKLLDVAGYGRTGGDGEVRLSLNGFHCMDVPPAAGRNTLGYEHPINVVVTSRSGSPVHMAATAAIGPGENRPQDVFITVSSWDLGGNPVGSIPFYWRCQVPVVSVVG